METSASFEARYATSLYPTNQVIVGSNGSLNSFEKKVEALEAPKWFASGVRIASLEARGARRDVRQIHVILARLFRIGPIGRGNMSTTRRNFLVGVGKVFSGFALRVPA